MDIKTLQEKLILTQKNKENAKAIFYQLEGQENLLRELIDLEEKIVKKEV